MIALTALYLYDYLLTFADEVSPLLTTKPGYTTISLHYCSSSMRGEERRPGVSQLSQWSSSLDANRILVFFLFLAVRSSSSSEGNASLICHQNRYIPVLYRIWIIVREYLQLL